MRILQKGGSCLEEDQPRRRRNETSIERTMEYHTIARCITCCVADPPFRRKRCSFTPTRGGGGIQNRIKSRSNMSDLRAVVIGEEASRFPSGKERRTPRGRRGLSYTLHRWGPWGPITGATSSLAILPQIATLKRGTAPPLLEPRSRADCSVHRATSRNVGFTTGAPAAAATAPLPFPRTPRTGPRVHHPLLPRLSLPPYACPRRVIL